MLSSSTYIGLSQDRINMALAFSRHFDALLVHTSYGLWLQIAITEVPDHAQGKTERRQKSIAVGTRMSPAADKDSH